MNKLSYPILACSVAGLVALFLPNAEGPSVFGTFAALDSARAVLVVAAFAVPAILAVWSMLRPPEPWHATATLAGYAVATVLFQVWSMVRHLPDGPVSMLLLFAAIVIGAFCAIIAFAKQRDAAA